MRSLDELIAKTASGTVLPEVIIQTDAQEQMTDAEVLRKQMKKRLEILRETVDAALAGHWNTKLIQDDKDKYAASRHSPLSGPLVWRASQIAVALGTCNASMGRIVAAPTAGSCGILPGLLFAWQEQRHGSDEQMLEGLIVAAGVGEVVSERATLAGASGGCQAECGVAAAMGAAALCYMEGGEAEACAHAAALTLKSILGLACDPVAGLVESPCVKRNGALVALGAVCADMALAGIRSIIPPDEVIDAMGEVGRALPPSLRETARGGCAMTPTGKALTKQLQEKRTRAGC
ncbi:MAG: L-serine ammonia-lyase, iron-sulfur-dependent, subunit alpha [Pyramidobacter sp.]|jgi:L-serine dehydratase